MRKPIFPSKAERRVTDLIDVKSPSPVGCWTLSPALSQEMALARQSKVTLLRGSTRETQLESRRSQVQACPQGSMPLLAAELRTR